MAEEYADDEFEDSAESLSETDHMFADDGFLRGYDAASQDEYEEDEIDKAFE